VVLIMEHGIFRIDQYGYARFAADALSNKVDRRALDWAKSQ